MDDPEDYFFGIVDYVLFFAMLVVSIFIGLYTAFFGKNKQNTISDYLLGGRKMGVFPTAMSLTASYVNALMITGAPSEIYTYGIQYWASQLGKIVACFVMIYISLPVYYNLKLTSAFEYLNMRYNNTTRTLISSLFVLRKLLDLPLTLYLPSIAFSQASGLSLNIVIPIVCCVCTFYTTIGGLKAIIWSDTIQMGMIIPGVILVTIMGTIDVGGFKNLWDINERGDRLEFFNLSLDITERATFWGAFFGLFITFYSGKTVDQAMVQRCLSLPSYSKAKICIIVFVFLFLILSSASMYNGLILYAAFHDCDPYTTRHVTKNDQLLMYYVIKLIKNIPGIPGIFVSAIICAALTTLSTDLNSLAGVVLIDLVRPFYRRPISEGVQSLFMKILTVILGCYTTFGAFYISRLGNLVQTFVSLNAIVLSPSLGVFMLGHLFPWANATGAMVGATLGTLLCGWISLGTQVAISNKQIKFPRKPVSIEGCSNATLSRYYDFLNQTVQATTPDPGKPFPLYTVSFLWYPVIGFLTTVIVGIIVSFITGPNKPSLMDPDLFSPVIQKFLHTEEDVKAKNKLVRSPKSADNQENE